MVRKLFWILSVIILSSFTSLNLLQEDESIDCFKIEISQDDKIIPAVDGIIELEKKPFKFIVTMSKTDNVYVSSSWGKYYFDYPDEKNIFHCEDDIEFKDCRFVAVKTAPDDQFNLNRDLAVGDGSYQGNWFYAASMDWHRFDKGVKMENGVIHAEMTVENIFDCDSRDAHKDKSEYEYTIENIQKDIYMVFATNHYERGMAEPDELQRSKFKLKFK